MHYAVDFSPWVFIHYLSVQFIPSTAPEMTQMKNLRLWIFLMSSKIVFLSFFLFVWLICAGILWKTFLWMQTSSISLIILLIFVQAYKPLPLSQSSSNNYISIQQHIIQSDILIECSFLDVGQCSSSKSLSTEPAANHEISNVVLN